jgi:hypothetical protein
MNECTLFELETTLVSKTTEVRPATLPSSLTLFPEKNNPKILEFKLLESIPQI